MPYGHYGKWRARWLDENGCQCSRTFDDHRSAKAHEQKMEAEVAEIRAGLRRATPLPRTFAQLGEQWRATRALRKRSREDDVSILKKHLLSSSRRDTPHLQILRANIFRRVMKEREGSAFDVSERLSRAKDSSMSIPSRMQKTA